MSASYFSTVAFAVLLAAASAAEPIRLTQDGKLKQGPVVVGATGQAIIYSVLERPSQLRLVRLSLTDGTSTGVHPSETRSEFEPAISVDGRLIAFVQNRGNLSLALVFEDLQGNQAGEVPPGGGFSGMHCPAFSPDSTRVFFSYPEDGRQQIFAVDLQGKNRTKIVDSVGVNNWPCVAPNGLQIVFSSSRDDDFEIYSAKSDGSGVKRLTDSPRQDIRPRYSPDGKRIAFTSNRDENYEIYVMNEDGSNVVRVTNHPEQDDYPTWNPDGKHLVIVSERQGQFDLYQVELPEP